MTKPDDAPNDKLATMSRLHDDGWRSGVVEGTARVLERVEATGVLPELVDVEFADLVRRFGVDEVRREIDKGRPGLIPALKRHEEKRT